MKNFIKNNLKVFVTMIITTIIVGSVSVYAASQYFAKDITFTPSKENQEKGFNATNVEDALNQLYSRQVQDIIPINMTSNDSDILKITGSSYYANDDSNFYKIFDRRVDDHKYSWVSSSPNKQEWIQLEFKKLYNISAFSLYPQCKDYNKRLPKNIEIIYSDDGINWNTAYEGQTDNYDYDLHRLELSKTIKAKYWKLNFINPWETGYISVGELVIYGN